MKTKLKSKKELRKEILQLRDALTEEERREKSHIIAEKVIAKNEFLEADKVLLFASYHSEVDTYEIYQAARVSGKFVYYPKVIGKEMEFYIVEKEEDLVEGYRGIREPEAIPEKKFIPQPNDRICVIMPGAVFDEDCNRIGYGGGYYDKFLQKLQDFSVCKVAVAFDCQMVEKGLIPAELYDIKPDYIVHTNGKS